MKTATAGDRGIATVGDGGRAIAGHRGVIQIYHFSHSPDRRLRVLVGYIGEDGLKPNTLYCVRDGKFVEVKA